MIKESLLQTERVVFHKSLLESLFTVNEKGVPSNADKDNKSSVRIARGIAERLQAKTGERAAAQTSGSKFEDHVRSFVENSFSKLGHVRPGKWEVERVGNKSRSEIARFSQYNHLIDLREATKELPKLAAILGNDYTITPDIIVSRLLETTESLNANEFLLDDAVAIRADLRDGMGKPPILHASISTKWTLRSDRAQNARSEALNLIRNRKGRQPHIMVVTGEPTPSRLSSLALGTGDIDCVYHFALHELIEAVEDLKNDMAIDLLLMMVDGKRLKDISDLPLDLAV